MEGLIEQLSTLLLNLNPALNLTVALIFGVLLKVVLSLKRVIDFHDEYFVKKRIKRLSEIKVLVSGDRAMNRFLHQTLETEAFKVTSGITASPAKMNALIKIHDSGAWTVTELRYAARHIVIDQNTLSASVKISTADKIAAWASVFFAIFIMIVGAIYFLSLAISKGFLGLVVGGMLFGGFVIFARVITYDFRAYRIAKQVSEQLIDHEPN